MDDQKWEKALWLFNKMKQELQPDQTLFQNMILSFAHGGQSTGALALFQEARTIFGDKIGPKLYAAAMFACQREGASEKAVQLFHEVKDAGLKPNMKIFSNLVAACTSDRQWEMALGFFDECIGIYDGKPSLELFNAAIKACEIGCDEQRALGILEMVRADGRLEPDGNTYASVICILEKNYKNEEANKLREEMESACHINYLEKSHQTKHVLKDNVVVDAKMLTKMREYRASGKWEQALTILDSIKDSRLEQALRDELYYCTILACARGRKVAKVKLLFKELRTQHTHPDITSPCHNELISLCQKQRYHWEDVREIIEEEVSAFAGHELQASAYVHWSNVASKCGDWAKCIELIQVLKTHQQQPSVAIYQHAVTACLENEQVEEAARLFQEVKIVPGVMLTSRFWSKLVNTFGQIVCVDGTVADVNSTVSQTLLQQGAAKFESNIAFAILRISRADNPAFQKALSETPALDQCRKALIDAGCCHELPKPNGTKIYVPPDEHIAVMRTVSARDLMQSLRFYHMVVTPELEKSVRSVIDGLRSSDQVRVRSAQYFCANPVFSGEPDIPATVERTFICLNSPPSLYSERLGGVTKSCP
jgi:hypothetical protein